MRLAVRAQTAKFSFGSVLQDALAIRRAVQAALRRTQWCVFLPEFWLWLLCRKAGTVCIQRIDRLGMSPPVSFSGGQQKETGGNSPASPCAPRAAKEYEKEIIAKRGDRHEKEHTKESIAQL